MERNILNLIRYRFFFFAGMFPYLLGQAIAFNFQKSLHWPKFWIGFLGIFLALVGVELFNEYFDAKEGSDRIFSLTPIHIPHYFFPLGILVHFVAFLIGLYLSFQVGRLVLLFSLLGFLAAFFYVGPPFRWAYRGLGEIVIALSYGPLMVLGSYYLQTKGIDFIPFMVSLVLGLCMFSLAILNEVPDYIQDKLVGKQNLVVRMGRKASLRIFSISMFCVFILLGLGISRKKIPYIGGVTFLILPLFLNRVSQIKESLEIPKAIYPILRLATLTYIILSLSMIIGYLGGA